MGEMLTKILKPEDLEHTFAIIMPDLEQPWDIMNHCEKWMTILKDAIFKITPNLNLRKLENLKERVINLYKTYEEPEFDNDGKYISKRIKKKKQDLDESRMSGSKIEEFDINVSIMED